jgi:hypothetical protein
MSSAEDQSHKGIEVSGSGSAASQGGVSAGAGGVAVGRDVHGNIHVGDIVYSKTEFEELREALGEAVNTLRTNLQRRIRQASRTRPDEPYRYLDYFDIEHMSVFFGRDTARETLLDLIRAERHESRLTLLHAPSGVGKTSLLRAGMVPALFDAGDLPLYIHHPREPVVTIKQAILPAAPHPEKLNELPLLAYLTWTADHLERDETLVILLDQFEEFFIRLMQAQQQPFIHALADCYSTRDLPVKFVLAMRKDYFSDMAVFTEEIENVFHNQYLLPALTREEAASAINAPLEGEGLEWEPEAVETLLDYLEQGEIAPPHLQLICSRLYDAVKDAGQTVISVKGVDLRSVHADYLVEEMEYPGFTPAQRELGWTMLKRLVTSEGTKQSLSLDKLYEIASQDEMDPVLTRLVNRRLLRRDESEGEALIEVAHDTLAAEIATYETDQERRQKVATELVERGLANWRQFGTLMDASMLGVLDNYRDTLVDPATEALEFIWRSALASDHETDYWAARARQGGIPIDEIALLLSRLRQFLLDYYDLEETRTLCFNLGLDYENLRGTGRREKMQSLLNYFERQGRQNELLEELHRSRPDAFNQRELYELYSDSGESSFLQEADRTTNLVDLHRFIQERYSLAELRILCFDLGVDFEDLPGEGKAAKARELVQYVVRSNLMEQLLGELRRSRPALFQEAGLDELHSELQDASGAEEDDQPTLTTRLRRFISYHFSVDEMQELCFVLGVWYEDLAGTVKEEKAQQLVDRMQRAGQLERLMQALLQSRPEAFSMEGFDSASIDGGNETVLEVDDDAAVTTRLHQFVRNHYSLDEIQDLCFDFAVVYENLPGEGKAAKARELVRWMERRMRLNDLLIELQRTRPLPFQQAGLDIVLQESMGEESEK